MRFKLIIIITILNYSLINIHYSFAQSKMTVENAIEIGLKNTYSIFIARNDAEIAKNSNSLGNAGFLPQVGLNVSGSSTTSNIKQEYSSGLEVDKSGSNSKVISAGVGLNWTLFDGMKMFATHEKLKQIQDMGEINSKIAIENTVASIMRAYYDLVKQDKLLKVIESTIEIDKEKLRIAELKYNLGAGSNLDYLQAKVDLNAQKSAYLKQQINVSNSKINLNNILSRAAETEFEIEDTIPVKYNPTLSELKTSVSKQNNMLSLMEKNIDVSKYSLKETEAGRYPQLDFTFNYNYLRTKNQAGFILLNQSLGWAPGFIASWNLFDGFNTSTRIKNAKLTLLNSELEFNDIKNGIEADLLKAFNNFQNNLQILALEEDNLKVANENLKVAIEKFKLGSISQIILHEAENSYEDAQTRLVNARYDTKVSEIELMKLNGELVK